MDAEDHKEIDKAFCVSVNMTPAALGKWLDSKESQDVGLTHDGDGESVGYHSGMRINAIEHKAKADLADDDDAWVRKVVGYVHRHLAWKPRGDVTETNRRYPLMNWDHDPLKD